MPQKVESKHTGCSGTITALRNAAIKSNPIELTNSLMQLQQRMVHESLTHSQLR